MTIITGSYISKDLSRRKTIENKEPFLILHGSSPEPFHELTRLIEHGSVRMTLLCFLHMVLVV